MLKKLARTLGLASLLLSATTQALPIVQADAFAAGDNKAALETSTGLVWMDFGVNSHRTFSDVVSSLDTDYAGWRLPTIAEVDHLWINLFGGLDRWSRFGPTFALVNASSTNIAMYDNYFDSLMEVFGFDGIETNFYHHHTYKSSFAVFSESGVNGFVLMHRPLDSTIYGAESTFTYEQSISILNDISLMKGTLLVKKSSSVPEPASGLLAVLAIFMLALRRFNFRR